MGSIPVQAVPVMVTDVLPAFPSAAAGQACRTWDSESGRPGPSQRWFRGAVFGEERNKAPVAVVVVATCATVRRPGGKLSVDLLRSRPAGTLRAIDDELLRVLVITRKHVEALRGKFGARDAGGSCSGVMYTWRDSAGGAQELRTPAGQADSSGAADVWQDAVGTRGRGGVAQGGGRDRSGVAGEEQEGEVAAGGCGTDGEFVVGSGRDHAKHCHGHRRRAQTARAPCARGL